MVTRTCAARWDFAVEMGVRNGGAEAPEEGGGMAGQRGYFRHGHHVRSSRLPEILRRVAGAPEGEPLQPLEVAARGFLADLLADLGPDVSAARRALAETAAVTWLLLTSLDAYCVALATRNGLVNKRSRVPFGVMDARHRTCSALVEQLRAVGLDRVRTVKAVGLDGYLSAKRARGRSRTWRPEPLGQAPTGRVRGAAQRAEAPLGHDLTTNTAQDTAAVETGREVTPSAAEPHDAAD